MPALWFVLAGIAFWMLFFTQNSLPGGEIKTFLFLGWFAIILMAAFETMGEFRASRQGPDLGAERTERHRRLRRIAKKNRDKRRSLSF